MTTQGRHLISVRFNRINGTAETTFVIPRQAAESWRQAHGKALPLTWRWKQECTASDTKSF